MHATLDALQRAHAQLQAASPDKGGHREKAMELTMHAMDEVKAGIEYAKQHPDEVGTAEPAAAEEPVDEHVAGAEHQPHMAQAIIELREAQKQLTGAKRNKGGHRAKGLDLIHRAMVEVHDGIVFADKKHH